MKSIFWFGCFLAFGFDMLCVCDTTTTTTGGGGVLVLKKKITAS